MGCNLLWCQGSIQGAFRVSGSSPTAHLPLLKILSAQLVEDGGEHAMAVNSTLFKVEGFAAGAEALERLSVFVFFYIVVTAGCWSHIDIRCTVHAD